METILLTGMTLLVTAAVTAAGYEAVLLAGRDNTAGRWMRHLLVEPQSGGTVLPRLKLMTLMLAYAAVAMALAPLVIAAEALVLVRRHHRGEVIAPAPWPRATGQAGGRP